MRIITNTDPETPIETKLVDVCWQARKDGSGERDLILLCGLADDDWKVVKAEDVFRIED